MSDRSTTKMFTQKAELVSARVYSVNTLKQALEKTVEICQTKSCLDSQMEALENLDNKARVVAAPNLDDALFDKLNDICREKGGISLIREGLRDFPGGIDLGLTLIDYGIADTGTLVLDSRSEETRLATMLCEIHAAILHTSKIRKTAFDLIKELNDMAENPGGYTAFITGASRTADIERVLAIGVHGPLELHIMLVED